MIKIVKLEEKFCELNSKRNSWIFLWLAAAYKFLKSLCRDIKLKQLID